MKKVFKSKIFIALLLNIIWICFFIILYKPAINVDDLRPWYYMNGVYTGKPDDFLLYNNQFFALILKCLLHINDRLPWYTLVEYLMLFISFCMLVYELIERFGTKMGMHISCVILFFYGYEAYTMAAFTKTSGIIGAIACYCLLSNYLNKKYKCLAVLLLFFSALLRENFLLFFVVGYAFFIICDVLNKKEFHSDNLRCAASRLIILCACIVAAFIVNDIGSSLKTDEARMFYKRDGYRSLVYDYGLASNYDEYESELKRIGITKNIIELWETNNFDSVYPSTEVLEQFKSIVSNKEETTFLEKVKNGVSINNIMGFFKEYPLLFLKIDVFGATALLWAVFAIYGYNARCQLIRIFESFILQLGAMYALYIGGRYRIHRVDVSVCLLALLGFLLFQHNEKLYISKQKVIYYALIMVVALCVFPKDDSDVFPRTDEFKTTIYQNRLFYNKTNEAMENVYFQIISLENGYYESFVNESPFETLPRGYYKNVFFSWMTPAKLKVLKEEYNINDIYIDIVNASNVYLVLNDDSNMLESTELYIEDRVGKDIDIDILKHYANKNIYRVHTKEYNWDYLESYSVAKANKIDLNYKLTRNNKVVVKGMIQDRESNLFLDDVFLKEVNESNPKTSIWPLKVDINKDVGNFRKELNNIEEDSELYLLIVNNEDKTIYSYKLEE